MKATYEPTPDSQTLVDCSNLAQSLASCITEAFENADELYREKFGELAKQCGSTAVVCLIIG